MNNNPQDKERDRRTPPTTVPRRRGKSLSLVTSPLPASNGPSSGPIVGQTTPPMMAMGASAFALTNSASVSTALPRHGSQSQVQGQNFQAREDGANVGDRTRTISGPTPARFSRAFDPSGSATPTGVNASPLQTSPRAHRYSRNPGTMMGPDGRPRRRSSVVAPGGAAPVVSMTGSMANDFGGADGGLATPTRPRLSRSPSSSTSALAGSGSNFALGATSSMSTPTGLKDLLDGTRHTDELGVLFGMGWPALEKHLIAIGEGKGEGDFGSVEIIYR